MAPPQLDLSAVPEGILLHVLSFVDKRTRARMRTVNKKMKHTICSSVTELRMNINQLADVRERAPLADDFPRVKARWWMYCALFCSFRTGSLVSIAEMSLCKLKALLNLCV